jgi:hypothetical protein
MASPKNLLDRVEIISPCTADWDGMTGTDQIRYCSECHKYVYNLSQMTRREAEALVAASPTQVCARMIRDINGRTLTADSLPPVRLLGWRPGPVASAVVSAMIGIAPGLAPLAKADQGSARARYSQSDHRKQLPSPGGDVSSIAGTVSEVNGVALTDAIVTLTSEASGEVLSQITSKEGEFRFEGLASRTYIIEVEAKGYERIKHHDVSLQPGHARRFDVAMVKQVTMMGAVAVPLQPLRTLYLESDRIVVAQVGKSINNEKATHAQSLKTSLIVSQTIKGDGHKPAVDVYHWAYGGQLDRLTEGETVLVFLQRKENASGGDIRNSYELIYGGASVKRLSPPDLETYVRRLEELREITGKSESDPNEIVEWLVRCAEDPVTRREGSFELQMSAWREEWAKEATRRAAAGEPSPFTGKNIPERETFYAALLTSEQKQRLMNALLKSEELVIGDLQLIDLASRWKDPRLLPFLMSYLHRFEETAPHDLWQVMQSVAQLLEDNGLSALVQQYVSGKTDEELNKPEEDLTDLSDGENEQLEAEADSSTAEEEEVEEESDSPDSQLAAEVQAEAERQARVATLKRLLEAAETRVKLASPK